MKKKIVLFVSIICSICVFSQIKSDLDFLKDELNKRPYLFHDFKQSSLQRILQPNISRPITSWQINHFLKNFKEINLNAFNEDKNIFFKIKIFNGKSYIIGISKEYNYLLEEPILEINHISMTTIKKILQQHFYLPHPNTVNAFIETNIGKRSLLEYLNCINKDSLHIKTSNFDGKIPIMNNNIAIITPKKELFIDRKKKAWFWSYGINYGQQLLVKFNQFLSAEHFQKMKDSLKITNYQYAKTYHTFIQNTYTPLKYIDLLNKIHLKFSNKRYQKLIFDLRNNTDGTSYFFREIIHHLSKIKTLKGKRKIYILVDSRLNYASISFINHLKGAFKPIIIGETVFGVNDNSDAFDIVELPVSKVQIRLPKQHQIPQIITPTILVNTSFEQWKLGIDVILSKCLE